MDLQKLSKILGIRKGITAIIGGGGKTTLMMTLADELSRSGSVVITTSTKIAVQNRYPVVDGAEETVIRRILETGGIACVCSVYSEEKLSAPKITFERLGELADYVLVEADGSKGLPLKAHASHEPVIPKNCVQVIYVVGADGFGQKPEKVCHRAKLYAERMRELERVSLIAETGEKKYAETDFPDIAITPELAAGVIALEGYSCTVFINKTETSGDLRNAERFAGRYPGRVIAGSLHRGEYQCL